MAVQREDTNRTGVAIKYLRERNGLTQTELGAKLRPPVGKGAINKWEKGSVRNIRRCHIEQMAQIFNVEVEIILGYKPLNISQLPPAEADADVPITFIKEVKRDGTPIIERAERQGRIQLLNAYFKYLTNNELKILSDKCLDMLKDR